MNNVERIILLYTDIYIVYTVKMYNLDIMYGVLNIS